MTILSELLDRLRDHGHHPRPVVVFDLDSTLLSTQERNHLILQEFVSQIGGPDGLLAAVERLHKDEMGWNVMEDLRQRGFRHEPTLDRLKQFWLARFFRDDYLEHDEPLPGAVEFVRDVHDAGAVIYYLTGRDEPNMGNGTRKSLRAHGFPLDVENVHLTLKPRFEDDDLDFKRNLLPQISGLGPVKAAFENEPANANMFVDAFPDALVLFLETIHSPNPPPLSPKIQRIRDFRR